MMKHILLTTTGLGSLAILIGLVSHVPAAAQQKPATQKTQATGQALEIAPPVLNLTANPGQTVKAQISLRDVSPNKLVVTNQVNDFVASGEDGTPKILLDSDETSPYSMKSWITPLPEFTLVPKQIQNLTVNIKVPANAAPGGYYSVIRFTGTPPELKGTGVSLSASLGSLVLLRVNGEAKEGLATEEFSVTKDGKSGWLFESTPLQFVQRLKNTGNLHEQPAGQVTITDMFGKTVATLGINQPPRNILPGSIRKFDQSLDSSVIGNKQLFGKYTATMNVTYGTKNQTLTSTVTFWVIPYTLIGIIIAALVIGAVLLRVGIKRYNRYIIGQSRRR